MRTAMQIMAILFFPLLLSTTIDAETIYVPDDHPAIQGAINAALPGDTIVVRQGTYVEQINFLGKAITVQSELGPENTVIDGNWTAWDPAVSFTSGEGTDSVLEGFTVTNGRGFYYGGIQCLSSSPTIRGNVIRDNQGVAKGGGIYCDYGSPVIENNVIKDNLGEGICCFYTDSPVITGNTITNHECFGSGSGICCSDTTSVTITGNTISNNRTTDYYSKGGGIFVRGSSALIEGNQIIGNSSGSGGGICDDTCSLTINNNTIMYNEATDLFGGGIHLSGNVHRTISSNLIAGNTAAIQGGGIYLWYTGGVDITGNTITENSAGSGGGGLCNSALSNGNVTSTIIWNNTAPDGEEIWVGIAYSPGTCFVDFSDVEDNLTNSFFVDMGCSLTFGQTMYYADPLFVDAGAGDYHLQATSPAKDRGNNGGLGITTEDFEGDPRIIDGTVDIGADEFHLHLYSIGTVVPGGTIEVKVAGTPGTAPVTLGLGSGIQDPPLTTLYGDLYLQLPILLRLPMPDVDATGYSIVSGSVPVTWSSGESYPFQALAGNELTNLMILDVE